MRILKWIAGLVAIVALVFVISVFRSGPEGYPFKYKMIAWYLGLPNAVFEWQLAGPPETADGQVLHPKMQFLFEESRLDKSYAAMFETQEGIESFRELVDVFWPLRTKVTRPMRLQQDRMIANGAGNDMRIRIYTPHSEQTSPLPVLLYFHGGAYMLGSIEAVDLYARLIANQADMIVVSVNYRLAPENPFPAALDDADAAYEWLLENAGNIGGDSRRIAVGGDSAGGGLALSITRRQIDTGGRVPDYQLLYYPSLNTDMTYPSNEKFGEGYGLDGWLVDKAIKSMFPGGAGLDDPRSDILTYDKLDAMPPTYVSSAGFDRLRDAIRILVEKLKVLGVDVTYEHYSRLAHNYLEHSATIDDAEVAAEHSAQILGNFMHGLQ